MKAHVGKVEHMFQVLKLKFGFVKVRYRGLKKNGNRLFAACAPVNLFMVRKKLLRWATVVSPKIRIQRNGLEFEGDVKSDTASVWPAVEALFRADLEVHCLRDLTRGGLSSALNEIASLAQLHFALEEAHIPVSDVVRGACELLGLDPLYVANEGRFVAFVPGNEADHAIETLRSQAVSSDAVLIGKIHDNPSGMVALHSRIGANRVLDMMSGEQLPRIC